MYKKNVSTLDSILFSYKLISYIIIEIVFYDPNGQSNSFVALLYAGVITVV